MKASLLYITRTEFSERIVDILKGTTGVVFKIAAASLDEAKTMALAATKEAPSNNAELKATPDFVLVDSDLLVVSLQFDGIIYV